MSLNPHFRSQINLLSVKTNINFFVLLELKSLSDKQVFISNCYYDHFNQYERMFFTRFCFFEK